jgi:hypothetical protein
MSRFLLTISLSAALTAGLAAPAMAQQPLKLSFHDGLVSIEATNVPVRTILTEWGKVGGTRIVGAERISGAPLTLKLLNVTEAKALETILRSVAGYMAAPRSVAASGPSRYDRILVMATTAAPAPAANNRPPQQQPNPAFNGTQRFVPPRPPQRNERPEPVEQDEQDEPDENPPNPPVFTFPQPGQQNGFAQPGQFNTAPTNQPGQSGIIVNPTGATPVTITPSATPGQPTVPGMPVGVSQPGMMVPAPQPQPGQQTPGTMIRPPGGRQ